MQKSAKNQKNDKLINREKYFIFMINFISIAIFRQFSLPLSSEIISKKKTNLI